MNQAEMKRLENLFVEAFELVKEEYRPLYLGNFYFSDKRLYNYYLAIEDFDRLAYVLRTGKYKESRLNRQPFVIDINKVLESWSYRNRVLYYFYHVLLTQYVTKLYLLVGLVVSYQRPELYEKARAERERLSSDEIFTLIDVAEQFIDSKNNLFHLYWDSLTEIDIGKDVLKVLIGSKGIDNPIGHVMTPTISESKVDWDWVEIKDMQQFIEAGLFAVSGLTIDILSRIVKKDKIHSIAQLLLISILTAIGEDFAFDGVKINYCDWNSFNKQKSYGELLPHLADIIISGKIYNLQQKSLFPFILRPFIGSDATNLMREQREVAIQPKQLMSKGGSFEDEADAKGCYTRDLSATEIDIWHQETEHLTEYGFRLVLQKKGK